MTFDFNEGYPEDYTFEAMDGSKVKFTIQPEKFKPFGYRFFEMCLTTPFETDPNNLLNTFLHTALGDKAEGDVIYSLEGDEDEDEYIEINGTIVFKHKVGD